MRTFGVKFCNGSTTLNSVTMIDVDEMKVELLLPTPPSDAPKATRWRRCIFLAALLSLFMVSFYLVFVFLELLNLKQSTIHIKSISMMDRHSFCSSEMPFQLTARIYNPTVYTFGMKNLTTKIKGFKNSSSRFASAPDEFILRMQGTPEFTKDNFASGFNDFSLNSAFHLGNPSAFGHILSSIVLNDINLSVDMDIDAIVTFWGFAVPITFHHEFPLDVMVHSMAQTIERQFRQSLSVALKRFSAYQVDSAMTLETEIGLDISTVEHFPLTSINVPSLSLSVRNRNGFLFDISLDSLLLNQSKGVSSLRLSIPDVEDIERDRMNALQLFMSDLVTERVISVTIEASSDQPMGFDCVFCKVMRHMAPFHVKKGVSIELNSDLMGLVNISPIAIKGGTGRDQMVQLIVSAPVDLGFDASARMDGLNAIVKSSLGVISTIDASVSLSNDFVLLNLSVTMPQNVSSSIWTRLTSLSTVTWDALGLSLSQMTILCVSSGNNSLSVAMAGLSLSNLSFPVSSNEFIKPLISLYNTKDALSMQLVSKDGSFGFMPTNMSISFPSSLVSFESDSEIAILNISSLCLRQSITQGDISVSLIVPRNMTKSFADMFHTFNSSGHFKASSSSNLKIDLEWEYTSEDISNLSHVVRVLSQQCPDMLTIQSADVSKAFRSVSPSKTYLEASIGFSWSDSFPFLLEASINPISFVVYEKSWNFTASVGFSVSSSSPNAQVVFATENDQTAFQWIFECFHQSEKCCFANITPISDSSAISSILYWYFGTFTLFESSVGIIGGSSHIDVLPSNLMNVFVRLDTFHIPAFLAIPIDLSIPIHLPELTFYDTNETLMEKQGVVRNTTIPIRISTFTQKSSNISFSIELISSESVSRFLSSLITLETSSSMKFTSTDDSVDISIAIQKMFSSHSIPLLSTVFEQGIIALMDSDILSIPCIFKAGKYCDFLTADEIGSQWNLDLSQFVFQSTLPFLPRGMSISIDFYEQLELSVDLGQVDDVIRLHLKSAFFLLNEEHKLLSNVTLSLELFNLFKLQDFMNSDSVLQTITLKGGNDSNYISKLFSLIPVHLAVGNLQFPNDWEYQLVHSSDEEAVIEISWILNNPLPLSLVMGDINGKVSSNEYSFASFDIDFLVNPGYNRLSGIVHLTGQTTFSDDCIASFVTDKRFCEFGKVIQRIFNRNVYTSTPLLVSGDMKLTSTGGNQPWSIDLDLLQPDLQTGFRQRIVEITDLINVHHIDVKDTLKDIIISALGRNATFGVQMDLKVTDIFNFSLALVSYNFDVELVDFDGVPRELFLCGGPFKSDYMFEAANRVGQSWDPPLPIPRHGSDIFHIDYQMVFTNITSKSCRLFDEFFIHRRLCVNVKNAQLVLSMQFPDQSPFLITIAGRFDLIPLLHSSDCVPAWNRIEKDHNLLPLA